MAKSSWIIITPMPARSFPQFSECGEFECMKMTVVVSDSTFDTYKDEAARAIYRLYKRAWYPTVFDSYSSNHHRFKETDYVRPRQLGILLINQS